ncbi:MAG: electron transfer flavoprotein subunit alpha/FixB family protein [Actinomycetota bacterium]|nr:electron transfer flavoprotein subunit alpha/FixB family protein [Actinomycetota bacterium]
MIIVLVETDGSGASVVSQEALTFVRTIPGAQVHAVVVGDVGEQLRSQLGELGVTSVHCVVGDPFAGYAAAAWAGALVEVATATSATMVVAAGTNRGNEILAHVATRLDVAMAANVTAVDSVDPMVVSRQVVGGSALEEMRLADAVAVFTVAGHAVDPEPAESPTEPEVLRVEPAVSPEDLRARVVRTEQREAADTGSLTSARVVVGAGRGVGASDGFDDLVELSDLLGGALGVSRVVTSLGWRPHHEQVGQTGSRITPDVYIPCGISGAIQHWAGCQSARTIIAINTDAEAPMVTKAHYAVIGDLHEVVPAINAELRKRQG